MLGLRKTSPELPLMTLIVIVFEPAIKVPANDGNKIHE